MLKTHTKRIVSWVAIFAVLMTSFAPMVSHALNLSNTSFVEVCTSQGVKLIQTNDSKSQDQKSSIDLNHCSYCTLATDKAYIPSGDIQLDSNPISSSSKFFIEYESPVLQAHFQSSHPPQAPPALI
jgi:Protein of unknown function (DUF2946)